jgi:thiamine-phosphate pyrophosphorylase
MPVALSPLYPILDSTYLPPDPPSRQHYLTEIAQTLAQAGVTLLQYRNKLDPDRQVLTDATHLRQSAPPSLRILLNDRAHLVLSSGCQGVHLGQTDLHPDEVRTLLGPEAIVGLSTHSEAQLRAGDQTAADYLATGPIYATTTKENPDPVVGIEGLRQARALTRKPLVAIGGITLDLAPEVRAAGADAIAVISALFAGTAANPMLLRKLTKDFIENLR